MVAITFGKGCTETEVTAVVVPQALKPVMVYVLAVVGVKATPLLTPPVQLYVVAPLAVSATVWPGQIPLAAVAVFTTVRLGTAGSTVTVMAALVIHMDGLMAVKL